MVMHARKTQRMNDGYFEKHQAHPYQNSKYSSSKSYSSSSDRYDRIRDSPNGNYRSDSPDSQSPRDRDRSYQSKSSYLQKIREKERENRDYKTSRDKYSDCARSPKEKRSRESEHRTNNDRNEEKGILHPIKMSSQNQSSRDRKPVHNNSVDKRDDRDRVARIGDWSEHVSSSGKKYYYNCKTEVSQWEKPREWVERERDRFRGRDRDRDRDSDRCYSRSGTRHDKHSNSRATNSSSSKDGGTRDGAASSRHWSSSSSRDDSDAPPKDSRSNATTSGGSSSRKSQHPVEENVQQATQDMDISPGDSTPTSEVSYGGGGGGNAASGQPPAEQNNLGPVLLANALPRLISHPTIHMPMAMPAAPGRGAADASPQTGGGGQTPQHQQHQQQQQHQQHQHQQHHQQQQHQQQMQQMVMMAVPAAAVTVSNAPGPPTTLVTTLAASLPRIMSQQNSMSMMGGGGGGSVMVMGADCMASASAGPIGDSAVHVTSLSIDTSNHAGTIVEGPPTPTHSETPDCSKVVSLPVSSPPTGSLSSLQGMSSSLQALRPQGPTITPSLANHYRDDLVNHVRGWPAEILEKQAQKLAEEGHIVGSIQCSKVSAELKSARSIVRLTEIQATLQEQRILFLRQQIKELEELKSQNSFMSDDS